MTEELLAEWVEFVCQHLGTVRPGEYRFRKHRGVSPLVAELIERNPDLTQQETTDILNGLRDEDYIASKEVDCDARWIGRPVRPFIETMDRMGLMLATCSGGKLLDVGCAHAAYPIFLSRHGFFEQVIGLDASPGTLGMARMIAEAENVEIELVEGFADRLPFDDESFTCVISNLLLHQSTRWEQIISEVARVLATDKSFFVTCFTCGRRGPKRLSDLMTRMINCQLLPIMTGASSMGLDQSVVIVQAMKIAEPVQIAVDPSLDDCVCAVCPASTRDFAT